MVRGWTRGHCSAHAQRATAIAPDDPDNFVCVDVPTGASMLDQHWVTIGVFVCCLSLHVLRYYTLGGI